MSEVVAFEQIRRLTRPRSGGGSRNGLTAFFDRHELDQILQVYSRRVMSGEWLDYALQWDEGGAAFAIYGTLSSVPLYIVRKRPPAGRRPGGRYQVQARGRVLKSDNRLAAVLGVLARPRPALVAPA